MKNQRGNFEEIWCYYQKFILPTYQTKKNSKKYVLKFTTGFCSKLGISYEINEEEIYISQEDLNTLKSAFKNRYLYHEKKLDLYSTKELVTMVGCSNGHLSKMVRGKALRVATLVNGQYYFYKTEIDKIIKTLSDTLSFKEINEYVKLKSQHEDIPPITVRSYLKKHFKTFPNPFDKYDLRILRKEINSLILILNESYKNREQKNYYKEVFKEFERYEENIELIDDSSNNYIDYHVFRKWYFEKYPLSSSGQGGGYKVVRHVLNICKEKNIKWFTNGMFDNIYIFKSETDRYLSYYEHISYVINSGEYYRNAEVQELFVIKNTDGIADYSGFETFFNQHRFIKKNKVDELNELLMNSITAKELSEQLNIPERRLFTVLKQLEIDYIKGNEIPLVPGSIVRKKDAELIRDFIISKVEVEKVKNLNGKYSILTRNIVFKSDIPKTITAYNDFAIGRLADNDSPFILKVLVYIHNEILPKLDKEIMYHNQLEVLDLSKSIEYKMYQREFTYFVNHCKQYFPTEYPSKVRLDINSNANRREIEAYRYDQWIQFGLMLFNEQHVNYPTLLRKAISSRTSAMVWLYCAMHYVCGRRTNGIQKIFPPNLEVVLGKGEEEVIACIENGNFSEGMAQAVVNDLMIKINAFQQKPSKTKKRSEHRDKVVIEMSYVKVIGMLLALCESHRRMANWRYVSGRRPDIKILITERATRVETARELFGKEYDKIFGESGFTNLRATQTFMNIIQTKSQENGWSMGYHLASIIRGHKPNRNGIASSTQSYLEHINKSGDIDKITFALMERGTFGFLSHTMLKILKGQEYQSLEILEQNQLIKELIPLKPVAIELIAKAVTEQRSRAKNLFKEIYLAESGDIADILRKISQGEAPSKMEHNQCLLKAIDRSDCIYPLRETCIGCEYQIPEMYFLIEFNNRLERLISNIENAEYQFDMERFSYSLVSIYMPILHEAIQSFGKERVSSFINTNKLQMKIIEMHKLNQLKLG